MWCALASHLSLQLHLPASFFYFYFFNQGSPFLRSAIPFHYLKLPGVLVLKRVTRIGAWLVPLS